MKINKQTKSIKLDDETLEFWAFLKSLKINPAEIFRQAGKSELKNRCEKMKYKPKEYDCPF